MDTSKSAMIEKVKKLLALAARGGTEEEAAAAANMAAAVALKYGIDLAAVQLASSTQDRRGFVEVEVAQTPKFEQWISNLVDAVSSVNNGSGFFRPGGTTYYCMLVRPEVADVVKMTIDYLMQAINRLNRENVSGRFDGQDKAGRAAFRQSFRLAASQRLWSRIKQRYSDLQRSDTAAQAATGHNALVVVSHVRSELAELQTWMTDAGFKFKENKKSSPSVRDHVAYMLGQEAGNKIGLDPQLR